MIAKTIHYTSPRARKPFVALNCAAWPDTLLEAELFGTEKGVATGIEKRMGQFEAADGGTLFLDEIGDLSLTAQAKILRVLQERAVQRLGARSERPIDVRVLAATNKDLEAAIKEDKFREDLLYRLSVIHVELPPLREIREDIPELANHFLARVCRKMKAEGKIEVSEDGVYCRTTTVAASQGREKSSKVGIVFLHDGATYHLSQLSSDKAYETARTSRHSADSAAKLTRIDARPLCIHHEARSGRAVAWH